jgi:anthranilate synthase/aminodeoxychorismate synthase-like glutamine amidotransferase
VQKLEVIGHAEGNPTRTLDPAVNPRGSLAYECEEQSLEHEPVAVAVVAPCLEPYTLTQASFHPVLLVIDNFDSFTFNLVQYFGQLGVEQRVFRNNEITPAEAVALNPDRVLLSPGPCSPREAGVTLDIIKAFAGRKPIFGVCLGHQSIGQYFGGNVIRASRLMHGKTSPIRHHDTDVFRGMPQNFAATRYHSLLVERKSFPAELEITADTAEGEVMGLRHKTLPIWGVQFHPESIATEGGMTILKNFLELN